MNKKKTTVEEADDLVVEKPSEEGMAIAKRMLEKG